MDKVVKIPGSDHPITITPFAGRIVVKSGSAVVADSRRALVLQESFYPPVHYIPRDDADTALLAPSDRRTYCPYKGDCRYFSLPGDKGLDAVWSYGEPYDAVATIKGHLAFYPDRAEIELLPD
jgi:uncharacterized protein (DUF427 family)